MGNILAGAIHNIEVASIFAFSRVCFNQRSILKTHPMFLLSIRIGVPCEQDWPACTMHQSSLRLIVSAQVSRQRPLRSLGAQQGRESLCSDRPAMYVSQSLCLQAAAGPVIRTTNACISLPKIPMPEKVPAGLAIRVDLRGRWGRQGAIRTAGKGQIPRLFFHQQN